MGVLSSDRSSDTSSDLQHRSNYAVYETDGYLTHSQAASSFSLLLQTLKPRCPACGLCSTGEHVDDDEISCAAVGLTELIRISRCCLGKPLTALLFPNTLTEIFGHIFSCIACSRADEGDDEGTV
jgi:hypothetical protein